MEEVVAGINRVEGVVLCLKVKKWWHGY